MTDYDGDNDNSKRTDDDIIQGAVEFLKRCKDHNAENERCALDDLRFSYGEQWLPEAINARSLEQRPCLTINKIGAFIRQVTNSQRQQRPRIKAHPMDAVADVKIAEVITGIIRHIEEISDADQAYDTAFNFACRMGWGFWRVETDYLREDSFDQEIYIRQITDPFSVYFDYNSVLPDGSDAENCLITELVDKDVFERLYPDADTTSFQAEGAIYADWITEKKIRVAEYFCTEYEEADLVMLSDGSSHWRDELPKESVLVMMGVYMIAERKSYKKKIVWRKLTARQVLDEKVWPGHFIPVIPVYGDEVIIGERRQRFGMVRQARDPQIAYNFERSAIVESVGMAPKAKWLMQEGQDEGFENDWATANISAWPYLRYKPQTSAGNPAPAPVRIQPEPPPIGLIQVAASIGEDLQAVLGIYDPSIGKPSGGDKSGKAIIAEQGQGENSNYHYFDNLTRSIKHTGRILLDLIPIIYDAPRITRIIGDDGKPELLQVNQPEQGQDENGQAINRILNDLTVGTYDVVMDVGVGFASKRAEATAAMAEMARGNPELFKVAGDLIIRGMDFQGADVIADRLAAMNPLSKIDENSDIPPQAQMAIKQLQTQLQQAEQQLQAAGLELQHRMQLEQYKQQGMLQREQIKAQSNIEESQLWAAEEARQVDSVERTRYFESLTRASAQLNTAEINAMSQLLLHNMKTRDLQLLAAKQDEQTADFAKAELGETKEENR